MRPPGFVASPEELPAAGAFGGFGSFGGFFAMTLSTAPENSSIDAAVYTTAQ
jgi:hypothetical protein